MEAMQIKGTVHYTMWLYLGKKERISAQYIIVNTRISREFSLVLYTAQYRPKPFISGAIENKS